MQKNAWKCYVAPLLDACRAECAHTLPEPPLTVRLMVQSMPKLSPPGSGMRAKHQCNSYCDP
jgi:hypothetical protein